MIVQIRRFDHGGTDVRVMHHCVLSVAIAVVFCGFIPP